MNSNMLIRGQGKLLSACVEFNQTSKRWQQEGLIISASVCVHAHITGDIRPVIALIGSMPKGTKTNSMRDYIMKFAPVKWSDVKKTFKFDATRQDKTIMDDGNGVLKTMLETKWWEMRKQEDADTYKPFNLEARVLSLVKAARAALEEGDKTKETITSVEVGMLEELARKLHKSA